MAAITGMPFSGEIIVASRIVDYLSSGLYETPAACLKELVNNSYDADAQRVDVLVKPDADRIIIEDDGIGMTRNEFERHFSRVSESYKREDSDYTDAGRPKIGMIGIGFIAANELCNVMEVISTKKGSQELLRVEINFEVMRLDPVRRQRGESGEELKKADYEGTVAEDAETSAHYTKVYLKDVRGEAKDILSGARPGGHAAGSESLYGLNPDTIRDRLARESLGTWAEFDRYSQMMLRLGRAVPVQYHEGWAPEEVREELLDFETRVRELGFSVYLDGTDLRKPVVFNPERDRTLVKRFSIDGEGVGAEGYFYAQHGVIRPEELQGLLLRIRHAAIGGYRDNFLDYSSSHARLMQGWTSSELWADDRLEEAMNIDRSTLRVSHAAYVELQGRFHEELHEFLQDVRDQIYGAGSEERKKKKARKKASQISEFAEAKLSSVSQEAAEKLKHSWKGAEEDESRRAQLLTEYSVSELYELVVSVAEEVLPTDMLEEFVDRLTRRLQE